MPTLDWRDRPKASPLGGFLIQSRAGRKGNFEAVIPWPEGGLAHFWRDNDAGMKWHGPIHFGSERYLGASITESGFTTFPSRGMKNLEVVAVREDGTLEHWWRENGGAMTWHNTGAIASGVRGAPAIAYTGARFQEGAFDIDLESHEASELHVVVPDDDDDGGLQYLVRHHTAEGKIEKWRNVGGPPSSLPHSFSNRSFIGVGLVLTPMMNNDFAATWKDLREIDPDRLRKYMIVAAVDDQGALVLYAYDNFLSFGLNQPPAGTDDMWGDSDTLTVPRIDDGVESQIVNDFRGRPAMVHGDFGLDDSSIWWPFDSLHYGNLELVAPAKNGGIHHFWRDNGSPNGNRDSLREGWRFGATFGEGLYDETAIIQSNFGSNDHGNLEVLARRHDQPGFDFYWRPEDMRWRGPFPIGVS
jgi:hypothetical protein